MAFLGEFSTEFNQSFSMVHTNIKGDTIVNTQVSYSTKNCTNSASAAVVTGGSGSCTKIERGAIRKDEDSESKYSYFLRGK